MPSHLYRITKVFRETFDDESLRISSETTADDIDGWDSVSHVQLFMAVETEFELSLTPEELASISSAGDILALLQKYAVPEN